jgi:antitoxin HigA-1
MSKKVRLKPRAPIAVHPGKMLKEILEQNNITQSQLARHLGMSQSKINEICRGKRGVSIEMAYQLSKALRSSPEFWMNLQKNWEMKQVDQSKFSDIEPIKLRA